MQTESPARPPEISRPGLWGGLAGEGRTAAFLAVLLILAGGLILVRTAWFSDDSYITFRTVQNLIHGRGLAWNPGERVQAFTHPLWLMLVSVATLFTMETYDTVMVLSLGLSLLTLAVVALWMARSFQQAFLGLTLLLFSRAFVDYSTSGLENPLTHLLLAAFCFFLLYRQVDLRSFRWMSLLAGLAVLNRMDMLLFYLPALLFCLYRLRSRKGLWLLLAGFSPFILWELFSLFYYGFPFPNTAYAKLLNGIPRPELLQQGGHYLLNTAAQDPLTLLVLIIALAVPFLLHEKKSGVLAAGMVLYLSYVVWIGGDHMAGRFLAAPFLAGVILLMQLPALRRWSAAWPALAVALGLGLAAPHPPIWSGAGYGLDVSSLRETIDASGISDERAFYYQSTGLLLSGRGVPLPSRRHRWVADGMVARERGPRVVVRDSVGFFGYFAGENVHVIDRFGLGDPLLARLPPVQTAQWRPGHFFRAVPAGYVESLLSGHNRLANQRLAQYYDHLRLIISGPLWSFKRLATVVKMNLGRYDALIDEDLYRHAGMIRVDLNAPPVSAVQYASAVDDAPWTLGPPGIEFHLGQVVHGRHLGLSLDHDDNYRVDFLLQGREAGSLTVWAWPVPAKGLVPRRVEVPWEAVAAGFDAIRVFPRGGQGAYQAGRPQLTD